MANKSQVGRTIVVFLGPTLAHEDARAFLEAIYLPPASQGSIVDAVNQLNPDVIAIVDGVFQSEPAVRHKEILWAISRGIPVVGAASMGALRAAELYPHMHGVGLIYRWYRRCQFAPDDAVAVLHGPPEAGSTALTVSEIDLRMTFRAMQRGGLITAVQRDTLRALARQLNFRHRTLEDIVRGFVRNVTDETYEMWLSSCRSAMIEQKKKDACNMLELLAAGRFKDAPEKLEFRATASFAEDLERAGITI